MSVKSLEKKTKISFRLVKTDINELKSRTEDWILHLLKRVDELEKRVKYLENTKRGK